MCAGFRFAALLIVFASCSLSPGQLFAEDWKAGAAKVKITPDQLMWMSGYGSRDKPAEGVLQDLWAKALVLDDAHGHRAVIITLDLVGIDRELSQRVCAGIEKKYQFNRSQIALCCSHTHCGPVVNDNLRSMFFFGPEQQKLVDEYAVTLENKIVGVVGDALRTLAPARLSWGTGRTTFAVNRRTNKEPEVPKLRAEGLLKGPNDHEVPVLAVARPDGSLAAILCGYACHATTLSIQQFNGDYAGFAQVELEKAHPGAVAMFFAGCGADQNPLPRRTVELAEQYGRMLADAVEGVLSGKMQPISGEIATGYREINLPFEKLPSQAQIEQDARSDNGDPKSGNRYIASRARRFVKQIASGKPLSPTYPYPIQVWRLGTELQFVLLGGEVVVDYSIRIKQELGAGRTWVAGYSNDVMAYIPSMRVLQEGGYEGATAMIYYGLPAPWGPSVEGDIIQGVKATLPPVAQAKP